TGPTGTSSACCSSSASSPRRPRRERGGAIMAVEVRSTDANKALVRRAIGYNHGVAEEPTELFAPDFVAYLPGQPPMDRAMLERFMAGFGLGFPGHTIEIQDQIARGDIVVNRTTVRGVQDGEFAGIPATGRPIEVSAI